MKKIVTLLLIITGFWACNPNAEEAPPVPIDAETHAEHAEAAVAKNGLQLNNGARWMADAPTNANVKNLQAHMATFEASKDSSLAAHLVLADQLQTGLNKMISECKMKGADHDALHLWLEPLLAQVKALKGARSETEAPGLLQNIRTQVNYYDQYFE